MVEEIKKIEKFIQDYVNTAKSQGVVIGMSGGKDSLICAKLCVEALGKDKVLGIIMPNGEMKDKNIAKKTCELLGIRYYNLNIGEIYKSFIKLTQTVLETENKELSTVTTFNVPPRVRMACLYSIAGSLNYLVVNTSNLSEKEIGYTTKWGDNVGDFAPILDFTKSEVVEIGLALGLPKELVVKAPDDGLSGKTDEDKIGFSYNELDSYIRTGEKGQNFDKISDMHKKSEHKRKGVIYYENDRDNFFEI